MGMTGMKAVEDMPREISGCSLGPSSSARGPSHNQRRGGALTCVAQKDFSMFKTPNPSPPPAPKPAPTNGRSKVPGFGGVGEPPDVARNMPGFFSPPGLGSFRPPPLPIPGVPMAPRPERPREDKDAGGHGEEAEDSPPRADVLLQLLRDGSASWQERAAAIRELQSSEGYTVESIYSITFVSVEKQTAMVVAVQVYDSLVAANTPEDILARFEEPSVEVLYNLRTLSVRQRRAAAEYVLKEDLDNEGTRELVKAIKEHERRPKGREGFTEAPGDCLAFFLHRAAAEATNPELKERFIQRGLEVAASDSALARFKDLTEEES